ncbi:MAG: DUF305 domain-containing protein, partial [Mycobacteriaceae bacterium]|nr:DUF305 domain-containing protein [Mycobacteriaceae bacterium]
MQAIRIAAALAAAAVLASCGGPSAPGHPSAGQTQTVTTHNTADVAFATKMIPHHQQAVDMAAMVPTHTGNPQMLVIAKDISSGQQAEIYGMTGLLQQWGEPAPTDDAHGGMQGMQGMQGMVDPNTMNELQSLKDNAFDTLWMKAMIGHHQGAIVMAQDEIAHGQNQDAIVLAKNIVTAQQREIAYMTHLLSP